MNTHAPHNTTTARSLFAEVALLPGGWQENVMLRWDDAGDLCEVRSGATAPVGTPRAAGPVVSGMPNLHSHAFQRAMAGLTETLGDPADSFWSWRTLMYRFAQRLLPHHLHAIGRHLYIEMLKAGYTSVCEFHYVHHGANGQPYDNPAELAEQIVRAGEEVGMGMTLLPVLYQYSGFGQSAPLAHQQRFISSPEWILGLRERMKQALPENGNRRYGVAPHSLRAVSQASLQALVEGLQHSDPQAPIHIHIAEQTREVDDCLANLGQRPVQWLLEHQAIDSCWCLVHATHMDDSEYAAVARSGATVGLCLTTEANLGDGIFPAVDYLAQGGRMGIGSDSHVSLSVVEELRWLEYGQRLRDQRRNRMYRSDQPMVGRTLYDAALAGGAQAMGQPVAGLAVGQRADWLVLDGNDPYLATAQDDAILNRWLFAGGDRQVRDVLVNGQWVVRDGHHADEEASCRDFTRVLREMLG